MMSTLVLCADWFPGFPADAMAREPVRVRLTDIELMVAYREEGAEWAFNELVKRYQKPIYNFFYRNLGNRERAEDLAQEVFVGTFRSARRYEPRAKFSTFIFRIAANILSKEYRRMRRKPFTSFFQRRVESDDSEGRTRGIEEIVDTGIRPDEALLAAEIGDAVRSALDRIPATHRLVFTMRRFQKLSYSEIAQALGCPVGTVKSRMARAEAALRPHLLTIKKELEL